MMDFEPIENLLATDLSLNAAIYNSVFVATCAPFLVPFYTEPHSPELLGLYTLFFSKLASIAADKASSPSLLYKAAFAATAYGMMTLIEKVYEIERSASDTQKLGTGLIFAGVAFELGHFAVNAASYAVTTVSNAASTALSYMGFFGGAAAPAVYAGPNAGMAPAA